ncbi:MAG: hypothetical protein ACJ8J0_23745 [Longimicrobiaceae bacterium]
MDTNTTITVVVTLFVAILGSVAAYLNSLRIASRKDRLDHVDRQLRKLYGPLFALNHVSNIAWRAFRQKYRPGAESYFRTAPGPTAEEEEAWRLWMATVFIPLILRMEEVILKHSDLIEEQDMPQCFIDLISHISAYKALLQKWSNGDYSEHVSVIRFPGAALTAYLEPQYRSLKLRQNQLRGEPSGRQRVPQPKRKSVALPSAASAPPSDPPAAVAAVGEGRE